MTQTHIVQLYDTEKEFYISQDQYDKIMDVSGQGSRGIQIGNDYIAFSNIKRIVEIPTKNTFYGKFEQKIGNRKGAIQSLKKGFERAMVEQYGEEWKEKAKPETLELYKRMEKKVSELA